MPNINDVINTLSPEELDLLNSDPAMLAAFKKKYAPEMGEGVTMGDVGHAALDTVKDVGNMTKAGFAGTADLVAGNGLDKSVENIGHVEKGEDPTSAAATFGEALGAQFTPAQIAMMAALGKIGDVIGPWVGGLMKGWAGDAAISAVGKIKSLAKALGVTNLDALGKFLLTPITIGGKSFEPIISATSSPQEMLDAAQVIRDAAGKQLGIVSKAVDGAINGISEANGARMDVGSSLLDMNALGKNIETLKDDAVGDLPNLGKKVADQYDDAIADLEAFAKKQANGDTTTAFSDLSHIKTKIGNLVFKHGSPLESKAALNDVYHAVSDALDDAATKIGGEHGANYSQAKEVYNQAMAICEGLEGKVVDAKKLFDAPAFLAALSTGMSTIGAGHGILAGVTAPLAYGVTKAAETYAPQAISQGLDAISSPIAKLGGNSLVSGAIRLGARGIPVIGNAIAQALHTDDQDQ